MSFLLKSWFVCYLLATKESAGYEALSNNIYVTRGEDINISNISQSVNVAESTYMGCQFLGPRQISVAEYSIDGRHAGKSPLLDPDNNRQ